MHHSDPFLLFTSRVIASEMEIRLRNSYLAVQPVRWLAACSTDDFPVIWHMMNWNDFWLHSWSPSSCMHNLARIMSRIIMVPQLMKWPIISADNSAPWCELWFECRLLLGVPKLLSGFFCFSPCIWCELHANASQLSWYPCQYSNFHTFASEEQIN